MKKFIICLTLLVSGLATAEVDTAVFPRVYNFGSNIQIEVWNNTDQNVYCSGTIYTTTRSGRRDTHFYSEMIYARSTRYRNIYNRDMRDRFVSVFDSIFCR